MKEVFSNLFHPRSKTGKYSGKFKWSPEVVRLRSERSCRLYNHWRMWNLFIYGAWGIRHCSRLYWKVFVQISGVFSRYLFTFSLDFLESSSFFSSYAEGKMYSYNLPLRPILSQGIVKRDPTIFSATKGYVTSLFFTKNWQIMIVIFCTASPPSVPTKRE